MDPLHWFGFQVSQQGKTFTRTRRKFWDDVSVRGGQYSSAIILLTALYCLFQQPFTEMVLGLKFAKMRMEDEFSSNKEQQLFKNIKSKTDCWFYIKFWLTYWFAWPYFQYLAKSGSSKASEFIEVFTFIMDMKDQVKLKLSLRQLSRVYHSIDPQTGLRASSNVEESGSDKPSGHASATYSSKAVIADLNN